MVSKKKLNLRELCERGILDPEEPNSQHVEKMWSRVLGSFKWNDLNDDLMTGAVHYNLMSVASAFVNFVNIRVFPILC